MLLIRKEESHDHEVVENILIKAFNGHDEDILVKALRQSDDFIPILSIVAESQQTIKGYILFSKIKIQHGSGSYTESLALAPLAVLPEYQNQKIGSKLMIYGIQKARELNFKSIIVLGHAHYYTKFGFKPAAFWGITTHYEVQSENFMALELVAGALENKSGLVVYPKEFEQFD